VWKYEVCKKSFGLSRNEAAWRIRELLVLVLHSLYIWYAGEANKVTYFCPKERVLVLGEGRIFSVQRHKQIRSGTVSSQINRRQIKLTRHLHLFSAFLKYHCPLLSPSFLCTKMSLGRGADSILPRCKKRNLSLETDNPETWEIHLRLLAWCPWTIHQCRVWISR
jgi:hypothetical protein